MDGATYKRRQYLVDRAYQLRFVTRLFLVLLSIAALTCLVSSGLLWRNMYVPHQDASPALMTAALIAVSLTILVELLIAVPIVFFLGIRHTHRIVGPLKRLRRTLEAIGAGDFSQRITLRNGDALEDLAKAINEMAEQLQRLPR
ncbi:MAG: HAMP domain-containing protein [Candidatus Omnitrophica bacterium]|nr:HAMP domain-containing protein [Candidatus Omnitrophota bacterium]